MFIETYIAIVLLAILVPVAILMTANRAYQRECYRARLQEQRDQLRQAR